MRVIKEGSDNEMLVLPSWDRVYFGNLNFPQGSPELDEIVRAYIPSRESSLMKLLELKDKLEDSGLDLLWHLLDLNPETRISAEAALKHSFFDSVRSTPSLSYVINYQGNLPKEHFVYYANMLHINEVRLRAHPCFMSRQNMITENMR
jgi:serine/threonine protein kinase